MFCSMISIFSPIIYSFVWHLDRTCSFALTLFLFCYMVPIILFPIVGSFVTHLYLICSIVVDLFLLSSHNLFHGLNFVPNLDIWRPKFCALNFCSQYSLDLFLRLTFCSLCSRGLFFRSHDFFRGLNFRFPCSLDLFRGLLYSCDLFHKCYIIFPSF
jgi:hypothetical protein